MQFLPNQRGFMKNQAYISRGKKTYQQHQFSCIIPKDLKDIFSKRKLSIL